MYYFVWFIVTVTASMVAVATGLWIDKKSAQK